MYNRTRRLRKSEGIRRLVQETKLSVDDFVYPLFIEEGENIETEIVSMPGIKRYSLDRISKELEEVVELNIPAVLLFGIPSNKDEEGTETWNDNGIMQQAIRFIKKTYPTLYVITDVCFCEYTSHGHCGIIHNNDVENDATLVNIAKQVVSHAKAGVDMVAPSGMMDGTIKMVREALDNTGFVNLPIMAYSVKYASSFYGPFRDAVGSKGLLKGDKKNYQMDFRNSDEAIREVALDIKEGADMVMVKPGMPYLDIIKTVKDNFRIPVLAYQVSGEYSLLSNSIKKGLIDKNSVLESLIAFKRAGANAIVSYYADRIENLIK